MTASSVPAGTTPLLQFAASAKSPLAGFDQCAGCTSATAKLANAALLSASDAVLAVTTTGALVSLLPARSVSCAVSELLPSVKETLVDQVPSACTIAVPTAVTVGV